MPRRRGNGPEHTRARRRAQEATVQSLVADALKEAHEGDAAAQHDPAGSARAFLGGAALPAVRALSGAWAPTLFPAMHRIMNAVRQGLMGREEALYGYCIDVRPAPDTLQLTGAGSATSLHSSAPALLHALRTRCPGDAAPYLNQARAV